MYLMAMKYKTFGSIHMAEDSVQQWAVLNTVMGLRTSYKAGNMLLS
jgi:hypothetical protein